MTMMYLYAARNFSTLVGLASPDPLANMYDTTYFRATWILTALDAGFWTAMKIQTKWLRDLASIVFSVFYMVAAEQADEKVRKVRSNITVEHLRVSWNKGNQSPYLRFLQGIVRPRFTKWPPRAIRIPRPATSDYKEPVNGWLYYDGPLSELEHHNRIVLDIPGGGFVAMDPRCNDDKLNAWAAKTGLPILSLDYKKAPEYPYPYALNECYDVYSTIIKSRGRCIGLSGREVPKVVVTGDSAGGTLATSMTLMVTESGSSPVRRFHGQVDLPVPDGLVLVYPALDMNIGSWMSDEQMTLIRDRRMRGTNKRIIERKTMQYNDLVGTPHQSDDEDDGSPVPDTEKPRARASSIPEANEGEPRMAASRKSSAPEYAHSGPSTWSQTYTKKQARMNTDGGEVPVVPGSPEEVKAKKAIQTQQPGQAQRKASHHPEPMRTRLAMSSMISYFNDRVLTPEMMRAMIILYVGPHNRPDFSQDYLLSPILAPDVLLARFPKTYFLTGERDPLVDDTVIFAGRLRRVKAAMMASGGTRLEYQDQDARTEGFDEKDVAEVTLIPGISHGFLQFPAVYPPAWSYFEKMSHWFEDVFNEAERKDREEMRRRRSSARGRTGSTRVDPEEVKVGASPGGGGMGEEGVNGAGVGERGAVGGKREISTSTSTSDEESRPLEMTPRVSRGRGSLRGGEKIPFSLGQQQQEGGGGGAQDVKIGPTGNVVDNTLDGSAVVVNGGEDSGVINGEAEDSSNGAGSGSGSGNGNGKKPKRRNTLQSRNRTRTNSDRGRGKKPDLARVDSSDDILGRRMHGLAGGLTGLPADAQ